MAATQVPLPAEYPGSGCAINTIAPVAGSFPVEGVGFVKSAAASGGGSAVPFFRSVFSVRDVSLSRLVGGAAAMRAYLAWRDNPITTRRGIIRRIFAQF